MAEEDRRLAIVNTICAKLKRLAIASRHHSNLLFLDGDDQRRSFCAPVLGRRGCNIATAFSLSGTETSISVIILVTWPWRFAWWRLYVYHAAGWVSLLALYHRWVGCYYRACL
jgi:hypothetical protein